MTNLTGTLVCTYYSKDHQIYSMLCQMMMETHLQVDKNAISCFAVVIFRVIGIISSYII